MSGIVWAACFVLSYLFPTLLFHHVGVEWEVVQLGGFRTPTFGHRSALPTPSFIHAAIASSSTVYKEEKQQRAKLARRCTSSFLKPYLYTVTLCSYHQNIKISIFNNYTFALIAKRLQSSYNSHNEQSQTVLKQVWGKNKHNKNRRKQQI